MCQSNCNKYYHKKSTIHPEYTEIINLSGISQDLVIVLFKEGLLIPISSSKLIELLDSFFQDIEFKIYNLDNLFEFYLKNLPFKTSICIKCFKSTFARNRLNLFEEYFNIKLLLLFLLEHY